MRQGPHHSAQKSTSTGNGDEASTSPKTSASASIGSATGPSIVLQEPHLTFPRWAAATRFFWPHEGHTRITAESRGYHASRQLEGDAHGVRRRGTGGGVRCALHRVPAVGSAVDGVRRGVLRLFVSLAHRAGDPVAVLVPQLLAARRHVVG